MAGIICRGMLCACSLQTMGEVQDQGTEDFREQGKVRGGRRVRSDMHFPFFVDDYTRWTVGLVVSASNDMGAMC